MKLNFLKSSKNSFLKVCFKATFLFVLILSVITTSLSFVYDSKYKAGNVVFAPSIVYTFAGEGTSSNPYQINNETDLINLATNVNNGTTYSGKYFKLTTNISLGYISFTPIGNTYKNYFSGTFDGDNHIIDGLYVNVTTTYAGLFGVLSKATIKNIIVDGIIYIKGSSGSKYAGGISAYNENSTYENCANWCTVFAEGDSSVYVGGISGYSTCLRLSSKAGYKSCFSLCKNLGSLDGSGTNVYVAGINGGGECDKISRSFNSGLIYAGTSDSYTATAAGINGGNVNTIEYCYNSGDICSTAKDKTSTDTYYFTLGKVCKFKNSSGTWYYYEENTSLNGSDKRWNDQIQLAAGYNSRMYYLTPSPRNREDKLQNFTDEEWQKKEIITCNAYSYGISPYGTISNCYNYGTIDSNGYCMAVWTYYFAFFGENFQTFCYSDTFTFTLCNKRCYPIGGAYASVNNCYYVGYSDKNYCTYKIGKNDAVYLYNSSAGNEVIEYVDPYESRSSYDIIEISISKSKNSGCLYFYASVYKYFNGSSSRTGRINIFENGKGNKVFNGKEGYITYEEDVTIKGTKSSDLKIIFKNDSTWATDPAINKGYPYIKEMYW